MLFQDDQEGLKAFLVMYAGQLLTIVGSAMTAFGVSIWLFQQTGLASSLTSASGMLFLPIILLGPFSGTITDRYNRKKLLMITDSIAAIGTVLLLVLLSKGVLVAWHVYLVNFANGVIMVLQGPAFSASITTMVDKKHYSRCNAMMSISGPASRIVAPAAAAALIATVGFRAILWIDLVTFAFAVVAMGLVAMPQPQKSAEGDSEGQSFLQATSTGFKFIYKTASLRKFHFTLLFHNIGMIIGVAVMVPMILTVTNGDEAALGTARSIAAVGAVLSGIAISAWGGPQRKMLATLICFFVIAVVSIFYGLSKTVVGWAFFGFWLQFINTISNASMSSIWQSKIPPDLQGRVMSAHFSMVQLALPIITFLAGPLADNVFEPAMQRSGWLANTFGWLVGAAPGSGMSLMYVTGAVFSICVSLIAWQSADLRDIERLVPDFDAGLVNNPVS